MPARRVAREALLLAGVIAAVAAGAVVLDAASPVRRVLADRMLRASAEWAPAAAPESLPDAAIVALDPRSLRARPDWPWPRRLHAEAVRRLTAAGARVVAFDVDFSSPSAPQDDAALASAAAASGRVLLAAFRQVQPAPGGATLEIANLPIPLLAASAVGVGSVQVPVAPDGVVRFSRRRSEIAGGRLDSLAEAALRTVLGPGSEPDRRGDALAIDYRRAWPAMPTISMVDVLESRFDPADVTGRVVFVGATAAEFQDLWSTPLGPARPGVWIQALTYRTLAAEAAGQPVLRYARTAERIGLALLLSILAGALGTARTHSRRLLGLAGLALGAAGVTLGCLVLRGVLLDPVVPAGVLAAHYALGLEGVRRRFRDRLESRDVSLAALFRVGEATARPVGRDGLSTALALLGDVVDARGVALLRAGTDGQLDGRRLEWRRRSDGPVGCDRAGAEVLAAGRTRIFEGRRPGSGAPGLAVYAPLFASSGAVGVLVVERDGRETLDATALRTVATVGAQLALSADNLRLLDGLQRTFDSSIEAIASAVEARDGYTESHCRRLAIFATRMADSLGLPEAEIESIRLGALLHDVGKIGIRDSVLLKPGRFSPEERAEMERHAPLGHQIIRQIHGMSDTTAACVRHHHERWDGGGYPDGLAGSEIPLGARIVSVVDVWDALSTSRPYKPAFPQERVRRILTKERGELFDPSLVDLFLRILDAEGEEMLAMLRSRSAGPSGEAA